MAGMFDALFSDENASDLALAAGLLGGRGNLNSILSQSLMSAQAAGQGAKQRARQREMDLLTQQRFQLDLDEANRRKKQQDSLDAFRGSIPSPDGVGPDGVGPPMQVDPLEQLSYGAMKAGALDPISYINSKRKDNTPIKLGAGDKLLKPGTYEEIASNPKDDAASPLAKLAAEMAKLPPGSPLLPIYQQAIQKAATHQPPVQVSYGAPVAGVDPVTGKSVLFRPDNKGGMTNTGIGSPKPEKDLTEAQAKATVFLGQMRSASEALKGMGMDQSALSTQAETALAGGPANIAISAKAQQVRQTQDQWSEAFLRFKTGAAATRDEVILNRKTFFPVLGDKPEQVALKKQMRESAERDMEVAAGRGVSKMEQKAEPKRAVKRTGSLNGRKVVEYADGSVEYAD
jgi:hypothetical protein